MKENCRAMQHCQGSVTGVNSTIRGGIHASRTPTSQVSFPQPTVVHFNPHGTLGNATAPTTDTVQDPGTPARTVDPPSFHMCHSPSMACRSLDADLLMTGIASNVNSTDPVSHSLPCASVSPHTALHAESPAVFTLLTFHGKPLNLAPILGSAPLPSGTSRGPPSSGTGHPSPSAHPPAPTGPPPYHGPPVPSPTSPPVPPCGPSTPSGFPAPPPGPPVGFPLVPCPSSMALFGVNTTST